MDIHSIYFLAATFILCIQKELFSAADWDFTTFSQAAKAQHQRTACRLISSNNLLFQYPSSQNFNLPNPLHSLASSITWYGAFARSTLHLSSFSAFSYLLPLLLLFPPFFTLLIIYVLLLLPHCPQSYFWLSCDICLPQENSSFLFFLLFSTSSIFPLTSYGGPGQLKLWLLQPGKLRRLQLHDLPAGHTVQPYRTEGDQTRECNFQARWAQFWPPHWYCGGWGGMLLHESFQVGPFSYFPMTFNLHLSRI